MSPEGLSVRLRQRVPWEAAELGLSLVRENFGAVMRPWVFLSTLWAVACGGILALGFPNLAMFVFWWFQPLIERIIIHVLSRRAFGPAPGFWETLRAWPSTLRRGWFGAVTLWRFVPHRAFYAPIHQLEGLSGKAADQRRVVLTHDGDRSMGWGILYAHIEGFCFFGLVILTLILSPLGADLGDSITESYALNGSLEFPDWFMAFWYVCYAIIVILLRPGYVAGSFTLYLNRRMELEGWDLELAFRRLAARLIKAGLPLLLFLACFLASPLTEACPPAPPSIESPAPKTPTPPRAANAQEAVEQVMNTEEFEDHKTIKSWGFGKDSPDRQNFTAPGMEVILKVIAYLLLAVALFVVIRLLITWFGNFKGVSKGLSNAPVSPSVLQGRAAPRTDEVFGNVPELAWQLWLAGDRRQALGLLYRGTLHEITRFQRINLPGSLTEGECVRAVRRAAPGQAADYFARTASCWQALAYAHREPDESEVRRLCDEWNGHFAAPQATTP